MTFTDRSTTLLAGDFRSEVEASRARRAATAEILMHLPGRHDQSGHAGGGTGAREDWPDDVARNENLVSREGGKWFHEEGHITDDYVEQYGLPVTYSSAAYGADGKGGNFSVVLSERGDIHLSYDRQGGPKDANGDAASWQRDVSDVRLSGLTPAGARSLGGDIDWARERTTTGRQTDDTGTDTTPEDFGVGLSRRNEAAGVSVTSARDGAVTVGGIGRNGSDLKLSEGESSDLAESFRSIADAA